MKQGEHDGKVISIFGGRKRSMQTIRQCTAKSKRTGERCKGWACRGRNTCRSHGGTVKAGVEARNFKHGMKSAHKDLVALQLRGEDAKRLELFKDKGVDRKLLASLAAVMVLRFAEQWPDSFPSMLTAFATYSRADREIHEGLETRVAHTLSLDERLREWRQLGSRAPHLAIDTSAR